MIEVIHGVSSVYALTDLQERVRSLRRSDNVKSWYNAEYLEDLDRRVTDALTTLSGDLARAFRDYIVLACVGEARHARNCSTASWAGFQQYEGRDLVYSDIRSSNKWNPVSILHACVTLFNRSWRSGYGGSSWARIAEAGLLYGKVPNTVFLDHVVDLSHNSGLFLDKCVIFSLGDGAYYKRLLDFKTSDGLLSAEEYQTGIWYAVPIVTGMAYQDYTVRDLIREAVLFGLVSRSVWVRWVPPIDFAEELVEWGSREFRPRLEATGRGRDWDEDSDYDSDDEDNYDNEDEEEEQEEEWVDTYGDSYNDDDTRDGSESDTDSDSDTEGSSGNGEPVQPEYPVYGGNIEVSTGDGGIYINDQFFSPDWVSLPSCSCPKCKLWNKYQQQQHAEADVLQLQV